MTTHKAKPAEQPQEVVIAYKGFDKNLRCRDFQYEVGENGIKPDTWYALKDGKPVEVTP